MTHPIYDHPSVVARTDQRLLAADQQLGEARARLVWHQDVFVRHRTFFKFASRYLERPHDPIVRAFYQRACERVKLVPPVPSWESMWPGIRAGIIWDWNASQYGLCVTRGLTHFDLL